MNTPSGEPPEAPSIDRRGAEDYSLLLRYRRLLLAISLPLFIVVLVLAASQYHSQRQQVLLDLARAGAGHVITLEAIAKSARDHALRMQAWSGGYLLSPASAPSALRQYLIPRRENGILVGYTLDGIPPGQRPYIGQLLWQGENPANAGRALQMLDQALEFFSLVRLTHDIDPSFQWSYFLPASREFVNIYPWSATADLLRGIGNPRMQPAVESLYGHEFFQAGTPARNPEHKPYWTAPYVDPAGSGTMVSHGAPVYQGPRFLGIVGTDIRLATLAKALKQLPISVGRLLIVDGRGMLLADSQGTRSDIVLTAARVLPAGLKPEDLDTARQAAGAPVEREGYVLVAGSTHHAPWTLVHIIADREITALLLPRFVPYGVILAVLAGTFLLALYLLRREFINPALELVHYIQRVSRDPSAPEPKLPRLWQTWAHVVSRTFSANRDAHIRLKESEAFKSAIVDNALLAVVTMNEEGRIVEFNPAAERMFGHARGEAVGQAMADLIVPPSWRQAHHHGVARYLRTGQPHVLGTRLELTAMRADGEEFPVEISVSAIQVGHNRFFTAFISDLTEKRHAEEALRASEEQYRAIFNATSDALTLWNADGEVVETNLAHQRLSGFSVDEIRRIPMADIVHPSSHGTLMEFQQRLMRGEPYETEAKVLCKDGRVLDMDIRSVPMLYQGKQHALVISRDITGLKRAEEELARQRDALRQSEKLSAMGALLAGVAHELNNPLAILMGRAALLEDKARDPAIQADARKIHAAAERCGRIVRTFLAMARQRPPQREPGNLNEVVSAAVDLLGYGLRATGIQVVLDLAPDLPPAHMDSDQIGQLVMNLLVNAQQGLEDREPPRWIHIRTWLADEHLHLRVADNGPGVPEEIRPRIFNPFFTTKAEGAGTGVGLSVCLGIAREHGGELILEASAEGASFLARLPLSGQPRPASPNPTRHPVEEMRGGHALIVDDEPEVASLLADILESAGLTTHQVHSGRQALAWLAEHHCDFILSDIRMPDMDGPALWRALKAGHPDLAKRMAFITGDILSASIAPFLEETGLPGLEKPFTPEDVLNLVARIESV